MPGSGDRLSPKSCSMHLNVSKTDEKSMEMTTADPRYREVAELANELHKAGLKDPRVADVRKILTEKSAGTGKATASIASIRSALILWAETERPADAKSSVPPLPHAVAIEMHRTIQAAEQRVREQFAPRLEALSADFKEAANSCVALETQLQDMAALITQRTRERDISIGQMQVQATQNDHLAAALEGERQQAAELRLQMARDQIGLSAALSHVSEAREREGTLRNDIAQARAELLAERTARDDANRRSDIADVRFEAELKVRTAAEASVSKLLVAVGCIEGSTGRATAAEASALELRAHVATLNALLTAATSSLRSAQDPKPAVQPAPTTHVPEPLVIRALSAAIETQSDTSAESRSLNHPRDEGGTAPVHRAGESDQPHARLDGQTKTKET